MARKAGSGCITCRIRRVKCDMAKPACQRCLSCKRQCDGYLPEGSTITRRQLAEAARRISVVGPISQALCQYPISAGTKSANLTLFDVFRTLTAPSTASFIPSQFWTREILQLAHSEPAVWHATLALGAIHQRHELYFQGCNDKSEQMWLEANVSYGRAISCAREVKDPTKLLSLCLALVSITHLIGRWSDSQVHIMAAHGLLNQAGYSVETSSAAEMLTRLDLHAMTFSDSSAPYPYKNAPSRVWIDEDMQRIAGFESYAQAGTALFGVMRRLMMMGQKADDEDQETMGDSQDMMAITKRDLAAWEYKMAEFERNHARPHDQRGAISIRLYHTLMRTFLAGGAFGPEMRWDNLVGLYERILTLAETLYANKQSFHVNSPLSLEPGVIVPVFMVAQRCRHPWLRRRAIAFLYKLKRQEGMWFSDGAAAVSKKIMEIEGQTYFESDLANDDDENKSSALALGDVPWEAWAAVDVEGLPSRTSWAGIERVPEEKRMRETMVMVFTEERRIELSLIMSSGDELGTYGEVRTESIMY
ncbi:unnamed protein product [Fusarium graminearum]|uniref:Zn(2)-C6 fungal-type domain-containing protein n=1 Tax=Gibberella zeae TaxID=5518 RepID=A0A2H3HJR6_GIBZA|nr:hypothetical protein FG05_13887 [Fusarium graminearum]PCD36772.1 hypothetical protein FGRA07_07776 [Fusarium graminearum]CAF3484092.1 unnamed protein product [Fusarium graminearum]CAF3631067.1 unnamed protein product [Fusarium graminearum]CAG1983823.1 unnamed protein product [Fusarium graminearum]